MVAGGDPHLVALEPKAWAQGVLQVVCAIGGGAGGHVGQRRPGLRLTQAHGARESPVEFVQSKHFFLQHAAMLHEQIRIAHREHAAADADGGTRKKSIGCGFHGIGQLHPADLEVLCRTQHAALHISIVRILGAGREDDFLTVESRFLNVHRAVERRVFVTRNPLAGIEHRVKGVARMVGKTFAFAQAGDVQPVVQQKINGVSQAHARTL